MIGLQRIDRYIAAALLRGYGVVAAILLALFSLFALLEELDEVGKGTYGAADALLYVALTTPSRMFRLLPFVTLLGSALALWSLARREEIVVLRAAGMGLPRIALATLLPSALLLVSTPIVLEYLAPALYQDATLRRQSALGEVDDLAAEGFWTRRGDLIVEVSALEHGRVARDLRIYTLAPGAGLDALLLADTADPAADGSWQLTGAQRRTFLGERIIREPLPNETFRPWWVNPAHLITPSAESLSFTDVRGYIAHLVDTGQPTERWALVYWRMWWLPITALLTGLLAIPVALTGSRQSGGGRIAIAIGIGLVYYPVDQIIANAGLLAGVPAGLVAMAAPMLLAAVVVLMMRRLA